MDQGIINNVLSHLFQPLPSIYNQYKPIFNNTDETKILHWAHFDYIKPWALFEWSSKVELFQDVPPYPSPNKETGNIPTLACKPAYELWEEYKEKMFKEWN